MIMAAKHVILHVILFGTIYSSNCVQFQVSKDNLDKALVGHSVLQINGTNLHDCARDCLSFAICKSFDYDRNELLCKLNDVERSSVDPSEFITKKGYIFSDIKEWPSVMVKRCSSRPCKMNQRCDVNGASYLCRDITCEVYQLENGNIQAFATDENRFRDKALIKCDVGYVPSQPEVECQASGKWQPAICSKLSDCKDVLDKIPDAKSGLYKIKLWRSGKILTVNCDMETEDGGWTLFHRRMDGSVDFYRNFKEYEHGFGNTDGDLWLGLKYVQELAEQGATHLRLDMTNQNNNTGHDTFHEFMLTDGLNYTLNIKNLHPNYYGEGLLYNNRMPFSTFDHDLDFGDRNCAVELHGGWWYKQCSWVNLNGLYVKPGTKCTTTFPGAKSNICGHVHEGFNGLNTLKRSSLMLRRK